MEISCEIPGLRQLKSPDAFIYYVRDTDVDPVEFSCEVHAASLKSPDAFFYPVYETDVEPVQARVLPVENVDPHTANVGAFWKDLYGVD
jgi:hypothetical protein